MLHVPPDYELAIRPTRGWFHLNLAEVWRYRDLLFLLVHRDFVAKYKQTILGPAWFVFQPLLLTLVFTVIFGMVVQISTDGIPPTLFYMCGLLGWNYFAQTFNATAGTLVSNAGVFGKVYFPRLVVPFAIVVSNLVVFGLQLVTFLVFYVCFKLFTSSGSTFGASWTLVLLPLLIIQVGALSLGVGLWLSALTAKYRDFMFVSSLIVQIWMYATPIIYPLSQVPERWRWVALFNPMTPVIEAYRHMFFGTATVDLSYNALSVGITVLLLVSGILVFNKVEQTFIDTV